VKKKTMWIGASVLGAVLVIGGVGVAVAESLDNAEDAAETVLEQEATTTTTATGDEPCEESGEATGTDDSDVAVSDADRSSASDAALAEVGSGTVIDVESSDDADHAFEVDVRLDDGSEVEVELDANFAVVRVDDSADDMDDED